MVSITLTNFQDVNEALQNTETVLSYKKIFKVTAVLKKKEKDLNPTIRTKKTETCLQIQKSFPECGSGAGVQRLIL